MNLLNHEPEPMFFNHAGMRDAESWVESIDETLETLGNLHDVFNSYELGLLYALRNSLTEKRARKQTVFEKYKLLEAEEEAEQEAEDARLEAKWRREEEKEKEEASLRTMEHLIAEFKQTYEGERHAG